MNWTDRNGLWVDGPAEGTDPQADEAGLYAFPGGLGVSIGAIELTTGAVSALIWEVVGPYFPAMASAVGSGGSSFAVGAEICERARPDCAALGTTVWNECITGLGTAYTWDCDAIARMSEDACRLALSLNQ